MLDAGDQPAGVRRDVAVQVEFGRSKILKSVYHLMGSRFETTRFQDMGKLNPTCTAPTVITADTPASSSMHPTRSAGYTGSRGRYAAL